jgi:ubiquinone/menaquinone biosynthesis C-methylase UbiE
MPRLPRAKSKRVRAKKVSAVRVAVTSSPRLVKSPAPRLVKPVRPQPVSQVPRAPKVVNQPRVASQPRDIEPLEQPTTPKVLNVGTSGTFKLSTPKLIFLKPEVALREAHLKPGQVVADLGAGNGFLSIPAALRVGPQGLVYAIDILKDQLASIRSQAKLFGLPNITTIWADLETPGATKIKDRTVDVALLFKVLCQQKKHDVIFAEAIRITKKGGTIFVAEWCEPQVGIGPVKEQLVSREKVQALGRKMGLQLVKEHKLDDFHYILEYKRA